MHFPDTGNPFLLRSLDALCSACLLSPSLWKYILPSLNPLKLHIWLLEIRDFSVYPSGCFLYLWEVRVCSASCDLPPTGQANNLHTYSCMTSVEIQLIPYNLYALEPVNHIWLHVSVNMENVILFIFLITSYDF